MSAIGTHTITLGDTLFPMNTILLDGDGNPIDLSAYTVKFEMEQQDGDAELAATTTGVTAHPTQTFTVDASEDTIKCRGHGVKENDQIIVASTTTLPTGLSASTPYFARDVKPNTFKLSTYPQSNAIDISTTGSGTHTFYVVGSVQMDFASTNVDTAGIYWGWFTLTSGSEVVTKPEGDKHYLVNVVNKGN